jgi:hypothetical protein
MKGILLKYFKLLAGTGKERKMKRTRIMGEIIGEEDWNEMYLRESKTWGKMKSGNYFKIIEIWECKMGNKTDS